MKQLTIIFLILLPMVALTNNEVPVFAGNVKSINLKGNTLQIRTDNAFAQIIHYAPAVVQVRISRAELPEYFSYALVQKPSGDFKVYDNKGDMALLTTDELQIEIHKHPFRLVFKTPSGDVISEEEPGFPVSWLGTEVTCYRNLFADEKFMGLGEKTGNLNKRGSSYKNWNSDVPAYSEIQDPLYQSIPFFIGVHDRVTYGIFLDNPYLTKFNFGASTDEAFSSFSASNGELSYFFFARQGMSGLIGDYTWLTGRMPMPPLWSLGYQQCRWSYFPESEVMSLAQNFRERKIPCDVIYLDIHYMDAYKIFTWDKTRFPQPQAMINRLNDMGFHVATIIDPGIKVEKGYFAYEEGVANNLFAKYPDGSNYIGSVWPGRCHFPDFSMEATRKWWGKSLKELSVPGVEGYWNDMNEPSAWGQSIPDIVLFDYEGKKATLSKVHNLYGLLMSRATYEGAKNLMAGRRPFVLTRAGFAGIQRYSAVWTGDNVASDEHMLLSARMTTGLGLSGVSFAGPDLGGFMGNPSKELYLRWLSLGVYTPFFRNHSAWDTKSKEPWTLGRDVEDLSREMIGHRYRLMPYIYSAFYESSLSGLPVARSLAINHPFDEKVYWQQYQNEYLFGDHLLVAPVSCNQNAAKIYLPEGTWYRFTSDEKFAGNSEILADAPLHDLPVYVRAGSVIPMQSVVQFTDQKPDPTLEIHVYAGTKGSTFAYYEDDGSTYDFEKGVFYKRNITYDPVDKSIRLSAAEGTFSSKFDSARLVLHGFEGIASLKSGSQVISLSEGKGKTKTASFRLTRDEILISY